MNAVLKIFKQAYSNLGIKILSVSDIVKLSKLSLSPAAVNVYLNRALKNDIQRIATGYYALQYAAWEWKDLLEKFDCECYLSGLYVLSSTGIYLGRPAIEGIIGITTKNKEIKTIKGKMILYRDFNFDMNGVDLNCKTASKEKALADYIRVSINAGKSFDSMFNKGLWNFALLKKINKKAVRCSKNDKVKKYYRKLKAPSRISFEPVTIDVSFFFRN